MFELLALALFGISVSRLKHEPLAGATTAVFRCNRTAFFVGALPTMGDVAVIVRCITDRSLVSRWAVHDALVDCR